MKEFLLMIHATTGSLGIIATVWLFVEALNASAANRARIRLAASLVAVLMIVTWVAGGYWYVTYYPADKAVILSGAWPWAHKFFMEAKEHIFFITLILSMLLPIITKFEDIATNRSARALLLWSAFFVAASAFALEGAGAIISIGVRVGLAGGA